MKKVQVFLIWFFFAVVFLYAGANVYQSVGLIKSYRGWFVYSYGEQLLISEVGSDSPAASMLEPKDKVVSINGMQVKGISQFIELMSKVETGSSYKVVVERSGELKEYTIAKVSVPIGAFLLRLAQRVVIPAIFLVCALLLFLLKPKDKKALLVAIGFGLFGVPEAFENFSVFPRWFYLFLLLVNSLTSLAFPIIAHIFLIFPEPQGAVKKLLRKIPKFEYYLYFPYFLFILPLVTYGNILLVVAPAMIPQVMEKHWLLVSMVSFTGFAYMVAALLFLLINYINSDLLGQRKMKVVLTGTVVGILPWLILQGFVIVLGFLYPFEPVLPQWRPFLEFVGVLSVITIPLIPLSFAYAVIRHQVIPVSVIIRRGVRYLFVSRGFIVIEAFLLLGLLSFLLTGSRFAVIEVIGVRPYILATVATTVFLVFSIRWLNQRIMPTIDKAFFRESYDSQKILTELGQAVRDVAKTEQIVELAATKIQDALHTENVTIFLKDDLQGDYIARVSCSYTSDGRPAEVVQSEEIKPLKLSKDSFVVRRMQNLSIPLKIDFEDYEVWDRAMLALSPAEVEARRKESQTLQSLGSTLLLPLMTKEELLGFISLGPRLADLPFSKEDKQLLMAVAWQMAFAIENAKLISRMAEEERLRQELEMAKEVQARLFPQTIPKSSTLELAGVCHPARGVGGDYYDFLSFGNGKIGIAVADVAGKGISAALLMSIVQASLRSQAPSVNGCLTELVASMNKLLHCSTGPSSYATFFYAQFDEEHKVLTYVNAGHNPPILFRSANLLAGSATIDSALVRRPTSSLLTTIESRSTILLKNGGLAIGLFDGCKYEQESIEMQRGDILVAYTDGVTEALSPFGEEFGEERLQKIIAESAMLPADQLKEKIVQSIKDWCQNQPQEDDLTLAIMKVA